MSAGITVAVVLRPCHVVLHPVNVYLNGHLVCLAEVGHLS